MTMNNPLSKILDWLRVGYPDGVPPKDFYPLLALLTHNLSEEELAQIVADIKRENPEGDLTQADVHGAIERVTSAPATEDHAREVAERLADAGWPIDEESVQVARAVAAGGDLEDGTDEKATDENETAERADTEHASSESENAAAGSTEAAAEAATEENGAPAPGSAAESSDAGRWRVLPDASDPSAGAPTPVDPQPGPEPDPAPEPVPAPQPEQGPATFGGSEVSSNAVQRILDWLSAGYPAGIPATDRLPLLALLRRQLTDDEAREIASHLVDEAGHRIVDPTDAGVAITRYTNDLPTEAEMRRVAEHLAEKGWPLGERR
jgi:hypothetical protein